MSRPCTPALKSATRPSPVIVAIAAIAATTVTEKVKVLSQRSFSLRSQGEWFPYDR